MKCLDTYPLIEIAIGNEKFTSLLNEDFVITDITISEFYYVLLQRYNEQTADFWYRKLEPYCVIVPRETLIKAVKFRHENKKRDLAFFDCVGYIFAIENNYKFLTGDNEFEDFENVIYLK
ncbi:PIN domain-containing protein [Candidatus Woesearchaeota archaeon]|nr:PIN domain-containing protein [Candidatus Woesearchaeota archaeon]